MPVPNTIADLSQSAASNSPLGTDTVGPSLDDYLRAGFSFTRQMFDGTPFQLTGVAGVDTITGTSPVPFSAYVAGQSFRFVAAGANATNAVTLNINGLGAKAVTKRGAVPLSVGDIRSGAEIVVMYDGTQFQLVGGMAMGRLIGVQTFTASGTYTPTPGTQYAIVEVLGGGGAGGGGVATGAGQYAVGSGGAAGGFSRGLIAAPVVTTVTVGAGGVAANGANGGGGGQSSFGTAIVVNGGNGGIVGVAGAVTGANAPSGGTIATPGSIVSVNGAYGASAFAINSLGTGLTGSGGSTMYGAGAPGVVSGGPGSAGLGFGSGGSGAFNIASQGAIPGGAGRPGLVLVYEYN